MSSGRGPEVSVALVLRVGDHVLTLRRKNGCYTFPGGHIEWGETMQQALRREINEELAYNLPTQPKHIDTYEYISPDKTAHNLMLHNLLVLDERLPITLGDDEIDSEVFWLSRNELSKRIHDPKFLEKMFSVG